MLSTSSGLLRPCTKPCTNQGHVWRRAFQLQAGLFVAGGDRDFDEILLVVALGMAGSVLRQAENGTLFRFRPQAFAGHVSPDSGEDLGAEHAQTKNADHDGDEDANNDEQLPGDGKAVEHFFLRSHSDVPEIREAGNAPPPQAEKRKARFVAAHLPHGCWHGQHETLAFQKPPIAVTE